MSNVDSNADAAVDAQTATYGGTPPPFGHAMHKFFGFDPTYINLNHGSYGSMPHPVARACDALSRRVEANPDRFMRLELPGRLRAVRTRLAALVGAEVDEVVITANASHGLNTVLKNFEWHAGDVLIGTTTTYNAIERTIQYLHDVPPHPEIAEFALAYPVSQAEIVDAFRAHVRRVKAAQAQRADAANLKVVAVIDSIVANPGVLYPWKEAVQVCREEGVWSVVDAAHSVGQELDINLAEAKPDFWVSNCHKWLFAKRGCAILYVPKRHVAALDACSGMPSDRTTSSRNQHLMKSPFPTSHRYVSPADPPTKVPNFIANFHRTGTRDFIPYLSVDAALDFREWLGGEAKINEYCHALALAGGTRLAQVMGTELLDASGAQTLAMVNVALPLAAAVPDVAGVHALFAEKLLREWNTYAAYYKHNGRWWIRCSAQIWNEVSDFEYLGKAFNAVCPEVEKAFLPQSA